MKRLLCILAFGFLFWSHGDRLSATAQEASATDESQALDAIARGSADLPEKVELLDEHLEKYPDSVGAHNLRGLYFIEMHRWGDAIQALERSIALSEYDRFAHYNLGIVYVMRRKWDKAEGVFYKMTKLFPDHAQALGGLGMVYLTQGKMDEGKELIDRALETRSGDDSIFANITAIYAHMSRFDEAEAVFEKWSSFRPNSPVLFEYQGHAYWHAEKYAEAEAAYFKALSGPVDRRRTPRLFRKLGDLYLTWGRYEDAMMHFRAAVESMTDSVGKVTKRHRAILAAKVARSKKSLAEKEELLRGIPAEFAANEHAALLIRLDHFIDKATERRDVEDLTALEQVARDFINRGPGHEGSRLNFVAYVFAEKEVLLDVAVDHARRSLELAEEAKTPEEICDSIPEGDPEERKRYYIAAVSDTLGWALFKQGNVVEAMEHLWRALELKPNEKTTRYHVGVTLEAQGHLEEALYFYLYSLEPASGKGKRRQDTLEDLYRRLHGSLDGLDAMIEGTRSQVVTPELLRPDR